MSEVKETKDPIKVVVTMKSADSYSKMATGLNGLNTSRGGEKGFKGYAFEEMHAADARMKGHTCNVINNNGAADLVIDGSPVQLKMGYQNNQPKWTSGYESVVVDKGNIQLAEKARKAGYEVEESSFSSAEVKALSDTMRVESAVTKRPTAPITATLGSSHMAGKAAAELTAKVCVPFQAGANLYDVIIGDKTVEDAVVDTVVDGAVTVGSAYIGTAALTAATTAVTAVGTAVAETTAGAVLVSAATTATTALASTAVGTTALTAAGAVGTLATTAVATIASAPILPIATVAVGVGMLGRAITKLF